MQDRKCGECANTEPAAGYIRRVAPDLEWCPIQQEYVRPDENQCQYFTERGETSQNLKNF